MGRQRKRWLVLGPVMARNVLLVLALVTCYAADEFDLENQKRKMKRDRQLFETDFDAWLVDALNLNGGQSDHSSSSSHRQQTDGRRRKKRTADVTETEKGRHQTSETPSNFVPAMVSVPNYGRVKGKRDGQIDFWGSIPYAAPPVGALRFAPPEPPPPWHPAKLDATQYSNDCWQLEDPILNPLASANKMSEDCLYLNVFAPAGHASRTRQGVVFSGTKLLPVLLWFHGGAFQQGAARRPEYDGRRLAERGIVVVTINYRLGALGFLVSSQDNVFGNFGLMDQRAALDWIHKNIKAFGGDPDNVTLFGESAGAVMIGLHLMMDGVGTLFHRAVMQSNPLGYTFRSVVVADFIGEALKHAIDCRDLECLRAERVEEIMRAQSSLMGVPRSVGDFFTWSPTLTQQIKVTVGQNTRFVTRSDEHRLLKNLDRVRRRFDSFKQGSTDSARWSAVNVSQPMKGIEKVPDDIPVLIGSNRHEGEMFVHSAFPTSMPKAVYWMFVGALFRDSAARVLRHYRGYVEQVEKEAEELARKQLEEEESKIYYLENREELDQEYKMLLAINATRNAERIRNEGVEALVRSWSTGGGDDALYPVSSNDSLPIRRRWLFNPFAQRDLESLEEIRLSREERAATKARLKEEKQRARKRARALKEAAKVVVDYRPVMSRIIDDYLFRCPTWHYAHLLNKGREKRGVKNNNVFVYRFSHSTHIPGYKECWGKSCHTAELPYVFQAMNVIRSHYSTVGPIAQKDAPSAPEYPYTDILAAYRGALEALDAEYESDNREETVRRDGNANNTHTKAFQRILTHFFGDYFKEDADEELANDMAERWANFARVGDPNYEGARAKWIPWRYHPPPDEETNDEEYQDNPWVTDGEYDYFSDFDDSEESEQENANEQDFTAQERLYRNRALTALNMEVAEEDVFRTELRRYSGRSSGTELDSNFLASKFLFQKSLRWPHNEPIEYPMSNKATREAVFRAQEIGALGTGLTGDGVFSHDWDDDFFPELFELRWPPEGRLIERDCTCDMWDKIRYRY